MFTKSNKELTELINKLQGEINSLKEDQYIDYSIHQNFVKNYKWEEDNDGRILIDANGKIVNRQYSLYRYCSGYNKSGRLIQTREYIDQIPVNDAHLVPPKPGKKNEKK